MLLGHEFVIGVLAVTVKVEDGLTLMLEFFNILPDASVHFIKFLIAFLPRIKNDCFEQFFVLRVRLNGFQKLNELLLKTFLWHRLCVRALRTTVMIIRISLALVTARVASGEWLIAVLTQDKTSQREIRIVKHARLALEMASALHILALSEQFLIDNRLEVAFLHSLECINSTAVYGVCDDFLERLLKRVFPPTRA